MADKHYTYAIGRRKSSTAKVRLINGKGVITGNGVDAKDYFAGSEMLLNELQAPFKAIEDSKFDISVMVAGGGHAGQVDAIKLGFAKTLVLKNESLKRTLKKANLIGRDPREKKRKKFGLKGARKQRQFIKR